jgi:hypothetical protein
MTTDWKKSAAEIVLMNWNLGMVKSNDCTLCEESTGRETIAFRLTLCSNFGPTVVISAPIVPCRNSLPLALCFNERATVDVAAHSCIPRRLEAPCLYNQFQLKEGVPK